LGSLTAARRQPHEHLLYSGKALTLRVLACVLSRTMTPVFCVVVRDQDEKSDNAGQHNLYFQHSSGYINLILFCLAYRI